MSNVITFFEQSGSPLACGYSQWDWFGIHEEGPVESIATTYVANAPPRNGYFIHAATQRVFYAENGILTYVAGQSERTGNVDGPGATAKLGMGGLYAGAAAHGPNGELYLSCQGYSCIKKITRNPNNVETFVSGVYSNTLATTANSLLIVTGNTVQEYSLATKALIGSYQLPALNIDSWLGGIVIANGFWIYGFEGGPATVLFRFDLTTHVAEHKAGRRFARWNEPLPDDGPVLDATLYKCGPAWVSPDGQQWRFTGGDSYFEIFVDLANNITKTRLKDGTLKSIPVRQGVAATIFVAGMGQNGLPITYNYPWPPYPRGLPTRTFLNDAAIIDDGVPTPMNEWGFISQVTAQGILDGWGIDGNNPNTNATITVRIDGNVAGSVVTNGPCQPCLDNFQQARGITANCQPWFQFTIPNQYRDGRQHTATTWVNNFQLLDPNNGSPGQVVFALQPQQGGNTGQINANFQFGNFNAPSGTVITNIKAELLDSNNVVLQTHTLNPTVTGDTFTNVPIGNGYKIRVTTLNQSAQIVGSPALSNTVNVVDNQPVTVQIAFGASATVV